MKQSKAAHAASEIESSGMREEKQEPKDTKQVFKLDPNAPTSIINGNSVLFVGRGAREVTLDAPGSGSGDT